MVGEIRTRWLRVELDWALSLTGIGLRWGLGLGARFIGKFDLLVVGLD